MFQELSDILNNRVSPEVMTGISALCQALEKHNATRYKDHITLLRMEANNRDPQVLVDEAIGMIYNQVHALFQVMNLRLNVDDMSYDKLALILEGLLFKPSDFDQDILDIIDAGEDSVEIFTDILALTTGSVPEELMEYILEVPMETIITIGEICRQNVENVQEAMAGLEETVKVLNKHQNLVGDSLTIGMEALTQGAAFDDAHVMLDANKEKLFSSTPAQVADELISIALHVKTPMDALYDEVMYYVEYLYDDIFIVQQIHKAVRSRLGQMGVSQ